MCPALRLPPPPTSAGRGPSRRVPSTSRRSTASGETRVVALDGVDRRRSPPAQFTAIMGPSGSGKSTLMHCLAGLDAADRRARCSSATTELTSARRQAADPAAPRQGRLRLPGVQPAAHPDGAGEHHAADGHRRPQARPGLAGHRSSTPSACATGSRTGRASCPAASSSGWPCARALASRPRDHLRRRADRQPRLPRRRRGARLPAPVGRRPGPDRRHGHPRPRSPPPYADRVLFLADGRIVDEMQRADRRPSARADEGLRDGPARRCRSRCCGPPCATCSPTSCGWRCPALADRPRRRVRRRHADLHRHAGQDVQQPVQQARPPTSTSTRASGVRRRAGRAPAAGTPPTPRPDQRAVDTVAGVPGVATASGYVQAEGVYVLDTDGKVARHRRRARHRHQLGRTTRAVRRRTLVDGRGPRAPGEIAHRHRAPPTRPGYAVGDRSRVLTPGPASTATLVGIFRFGDSGGLAGASLTAFDTDDRAAAARAAGRSSAAIERRRAGRRHPGRARRTGSRPRSARATTSRPASEQADDQARRRSTRRCGSSTSSCWSSPASRCSSAASSSSTPSRCWSPSAPASSPCCGRSARAGARSPGRCSSRRSSLGVVGSTVGSRRRRRHRRPPARAVRAVRAHAWTAAWSFAAGTVVVVATSSASLVTLRRGLPAGAAGRADPAGRGDAGRRRPTRSARCGGAPSSARVLIADRRSLALVGRGSPSTDGGGGASLVGLGALALVVAAIALSPVLARPFVRGRRRRAARRCSARTGRAGPGERAAQPAPDRGHRLGADDRPGAGHRRSASSGVDQRVGRRLDRPNALGADYVVSTAVGSRSRRRSPRGSAGARGRGGDAGTASARAAGRQADVRHRRSRPPRSTGPAARLRGRLHRRGCGDRGLLVDEPTAQVP